MKIFVSSDFTQKDGDIILYQTGDIVAIEVKSKHGYKKWIQDLDEQTIADIETSFAKKYLKQLNSICDKKAQDSKAIIADMNISQEQMEEFDLVAEALNQKDIDWFSDEAKVLGTTAKEEFDRASKQAQVYKQAHTAFKKLIRVYRRFVAKQIDLKEFNYVQKLLDQGKEIGVGAVGTPTEVLVASKEQVNEIISN